MSDECPPGFIDISEKKRLTCTKCGYDIEIPPRTISMEKLEHMADVEEFSSFSTGLVKDDLVEPEARHLSITNVRVMTCKNCGNIMPCFDEFSHISEDVGKPHECS